jgi:hypothetical protein
VSQDPSLESATIEDDEEASVEYVTEQLDIASSGLEAFSNVFARFQLPPEVASVRIPFDSDYIISSHTSKYRPPLASLLKEK